MENTLKPNVGTKELAFSMRILESNVINMHWTYKDKTQNAPFEMPSELYPDLNMSDLATDLKLSDFIKISKNMDDSAPFNIDYLVTERGRFAYKIAHLNFQDNFHYFDGECNVKSGSKFRGLMGLGQRNSDDLFLKTGVYSMWTRAGETKNENGSLPAQNTNGVHPFFMG